MEASIWKPENRKVFQRAGSGRCRRVDLHEVVNAVFYVLKTGQPRFQAANQLREARQLFSPEISGRSQLRDPPVLWGVGLDVQGM